ncbi:hypothetical protein KKHLCK_00940 [Candidatus Electrothrix laxa]
MDDPDKEAAERSDDEGARYGLYAYPGPCKKQDNTGYFCIECLEKRSLGDGRAKLSCYAEEMGKVNVHHSAAGDENKTCYPEGKKFFEFGKRVSNHEQRSISKGCYGMVAGLYSQSVGGRKCFYILEK